MKAQKVDLYIYLESANDSNLESRAPETIRNTAGVINAGFNPYVKHLVNVEYDPAQVNSDHILQSVRNEGFSAWMFGM